MSRENVKLSQDTVAAYNRGGIEAALRYFDPNVEVIAPPEWIEDRVYRGHDGVRRALAGWDERLDEHRFDLERVIDVGEGRVVSLLHQRGRIKGSDDEVELRIAFVSDLRDGVAVRVQLYFSWEEARKAAGLEE